MLIIQYVHIFSITAGTIYIYLLYDVFVCCICLCGIPQNGKDGKHDHGIWGLETAKPSQYQQQDWTGKMPHDPHRNSWSYFSPTSDLFLALWYIWYSQEISPYLVGCTPIQSMDNPWYTPHGTACRATLRGATPQGLKNAALLEYDGTFEAGIAGK